MQFAVMRVLALRWLRGRNRSGARSKIILSAIIVIIVADIIFAAWLRRSTTHFLADVPAEAISALRGVILAVLFFLGGPLFLLIQSLNLRGARIRSVLNGLPLSRREVERLIFVPIMLSGAVGGVIILMPGIALLFGNGMPSLAGVIDGVGSLLLGMGLAAMSGAIIEATPLGRRMHELKYPVTVLVWLSLSAVEFMRVGAAINGRVALVDNLLLLPRIVRLGTEGKPGSIELGAALLLVAGSAAIVFRAAGRSERRRSRAIVWTWSPGKFPLFRLEIIRLFRSRFFVGNVAAASIVGILALASLIRLPYSTRLAITPAVGPGAAIFTSIALVGARGITRLKRPIEVRVGWSPRYWALTTAMSAFSVVLVFGLLPQFVMLDLLGVPMHSWLLIELFFFMAASGLVLAAGWLAPADSDNPIGQVVTTFCSLIGSSGLLILVGRQFHQGTISWSLSTFLIFGIGLTMLQWIEKRRNSVETPSSAKPLSAYVTQRRSWLPIWGLWAVVVLTLFVGLIHVTEVLRHSPVDRTAHLNLLWMPIYSGFRHAGRIGVQVDWGVLVVAFGPPAVMLARSSHQTLTGLKSGRRKKVLEASRC
jgi:hypothetical protein